MTGSGGHARSGPPPSPTALHRGDRTDGFRHLTVPTEPAPPWPLGDDASPDEATLWAQLWTRPQASAWPHFGMAHDVALYCRVFVELAQSGKTNAALGGYARKLADDVGLTIPGCARNRWVMPPEATPAAAGSPPRRPSSGDSVKSRFRVVPPPRPSAKDRFPVAPTRDDAS